MSDFQFRFWVYLITYVDDYGRGSADPELLKGFVFPRRKGITEDTIKKALAELAITGSIILYKVDGESYLCFPRWSEHQTVRNKISKFPALEEGEIIQFESNCNQLKSIESKCSRNPIQSNPIQNTESGIQNPESGIQNPNSTAVAVVTRGGARKKAAATAAKDKNTQLNLIKGPLGKGVVYLSKEQIEKLLDKMGMDAFNRYVGRLADYIIEKNAHVNSHYNTILKWYEEDTNVSRI